MSELLDIKKGATNPLDDDTGKSSRIPPPPSSKNTTCRICCDSTKEKLISPCYCIGSHGFVHLSCLERWLSEAGRKSCEVCLFKFSAEIKRKSILKVYAIHYEIEYVITLLSL